MGLEDRDWWHEARNKREAAARATATRATRASAFQNTLFLMVFWLALMGALYFAMNHFMQPRTAHLTSEGTLVIPRHPDGHFRVAGAVNGEAVMFLVDTGATVVSVTDALAQRAGLSGGERTTFFTANGAREGRMVRANSVALSGGLAAANLRVGVGYTGRGEDDALLGQNFLQHFDMQMNRDTLTLRPRAR